MRLDLEFAHRCLMSAATMHGCQCTVDKVYCKITPMRAGKCLL